MDATQDCSDNSSSHKNSERYYYGTTDLLNALLYDELKLSTPSDLNDIFECLPSFEANEARGSLTREQIEKAAEYGRWLAEGSFKFLCASKKKNNSRMWAQYGQNHRGIMLTIDTEADCMERWVSGGFLHKVNYTEAARPFLDVERADSEQDYRHLTVVGLLSTKGVEWRQEEEERFIFPRNAIVSDDDNFRCGMLNGHLEDFWKIPGAIKKVTMGYRSDRKLFSSLRLLRTKYNKKWGISVVKPSPRTFTLIEDDLV